MSYRENYEKWLHSPALSAAEKAELESIQGDEKEIESRFFDQLSFGTAGLRGTMGVGLYRMNVHVVRHATQAFAQVILEEGAEAAARGVAVCFDCRNNSDVFAREAAWADDDLVIQAQLVAREPDPIAVRIIRWMLLEMGEHQFSAAHLQSVVDLARSSAPSGRVDLAHGLTAYRVYGELLLTVQGEDPLPPFTPVPLALDGKTPLPGTGWTFTCRTATAPEVLPREPGRFYLDPERLQGALILRPRQVGDRLSLPGRGEKTVKKLLIEGRVPRRHRDRVPILADEAGVIWLGGFGPHQDRLSLPGAPSLEITARQDEQNASL